MIMNLVKPLQPHRGMSLPAPHRNPLTTASFLTAANATFIWDKNFGHVYISKNVTLQKDS